MARSGFFLQFDVVDKHTDADDAALVTWLRLAVISARALNGGRFVAAKTWNPTGWARVAGVIRKEVDGTVAAGLARWEGEDLVLEHYDHQGEETWRRQSERGRIGAEMTNRQRRTPLPDATPVDKARSPEADASPGRQRREPDASPGASAHSTALQSTGENPTPSPPVDPARAPAKTASSGGATRVQAVESQAILAALDAGDLLALVGAFRADPSDRDGWLRETDGWTLRMVAHVLAWRRRLRNAIRQPSGFRQAREHWGSQSADDRAAICQQNLTELRIPMPKAFQAGSA